LQRRLTSVSAILLSPVTTGDFNADGKLDLASANRFSDNVSVLLGNGTGGFAAAVNFGADNAPRSVTAGDFNLDGKLDLATANTGSSNLSVLLGDGSGGFAGSVNFGTGGGPYLVTTGDFNADGRLDLATANYLRRGLSVLLNNCAANTAPMAASDNYSVNEDTPLNVAAPGILNNDADPDMDPMTAMLVSGPSHAASFTLNSDGSFSYTPSAEFSGADSFAYKANDGLLDSNMATVTITVNAVNDAPVITSMAPTAATEDVALSYDAKRDDVDGPQTVWSLDTPTHTCGGTINASSGTFSFTPAGPVPPASCVMSIRVSDGGSPEQSAVQTATIQIAAVNDAPVIDSTAPTTATEDILYTYNATRNDPDGPQAIWSLNTPTHTCGGSINAASGLFTFTPLGPVPPATCVLSIRVRDAGSPEQSAVQTTTIAVTAVNDAPTATGDSYSVNEDTPLNPAAPGVLGNDSDPEGTALTAVLVAGPAHAASFTLNANGSFSYTPAANYNGPDSFTYRATDGDLNSLVVTVTITVNAVNDAPTIAAASGITRTQAAGGSVSQIATIGDIDNTVTSLAVTVNGSSSATVNGVTVSGITINAAGQVGATIAAGCGATNASFTLRVSDPGGLFATATLSVTVVRETVPPVINPIANIVVSLPLNTTATSMPVNFPLPTATDNCGAVTVVTSPVSGSVFQLGTTIVNATATDANGNVSTATFTVTVQFSFMGFAGRVVNPPSVNTATAGNTIPITFSLSGGKGLNIFASNSPSSRQVNCSTWAPIGAAAPTTSSPSMVFAGDQYTYFWTTNPAWAGTCRVFSLTLRDGTTRTLNFSFFQ
jgi:VCBS repeat-containing protein